jgi:hypothetical protein
MTDPAMSREIAPPRQLTVGLSRQQTMKVEEIADGRTTIMGKIP